MFYVKVLLKSNKRFLLAPFSCSICNKGFTTAQQCSDHEFRHKNQRPFECHICDKTFKMKCDLRTHIMCHQDIRKHACPICGKWNEKSRNRYHLRACLCFWYFGGKSFLFAKFSILERVVFVHFELSNEKKKFFWRKMSYLHQDQLEIFLIFFRFLSISVSESSAIFLVKTLTSKKDCGFCWFNSSFQSRE